MPPSSNVVATLTGTPGVRLAGRDAYSANFDSGQRRQPAAARPASAKDAPITLMKLRRSSPVSSDAPGWNSRCMYSWNSGVFASWSTERQ